MHFNTNVFVLFTMILDTLKNGVKICSGIWGWDPLESCEELI